MQLLAEEDNAVVKIDSRITKNHKQETKPDKSSHLIEIDKGSILNGFCGDGMSVNSFHRQFVAKPPKHFKIVARCFEGGPEAIEYKDLNKWFCLGFQFHPEWLFEKKEGLYKLFRYFIQKTLQTKTGDT